jgi:hypothetical protein
VARGRAKIAPEFRSENRIGVNPITRHRDARHGGALQAQLAARALTLENEYLPAGDYAAATPAAALVVEGMPVVEFIEVTKEIEFVFRRELQWNGRAHAGSFASEKKFDNRANDCRVHRYKPDVAFHIRRAREIRFKYCERE